VRVGVHRAPPPPPPTALAAVAAEAPGRGLPEALAEPGDQLALDLFGASEPAVAHPPAVRPAPLAAAPRSLPSTLSYSSLAAYDRCPYRWYLERVLRLPPDDPPPLPPGAVVAPAPAHGTLDPLVRGSLAHRLLEDLDVAAPGPPAAEAVRALAEAEEVELTDADVADLQALVAAFADSPQAARLREATDVRREHGFVVRLGDEDAPLLQGVIDVLAFEAGGSALIIDYKTDVVGPDADLEAHVEADYGAQRRIYALAALGAGAPDVEVAHVFLARPQSPAVAVFDRADADRLRAELQERVAGLAAGRFVPTDRPHRALCATCPGRRALCHHPEELTLRLEPGGA
jgi:RecB family exonuclease